MELSWLEDFAELAAARNFSTAASARHITQPAFSRRIKALENWVGAELIDRSSYPVALTQAGETFLETSRELMRSIYRLRDDCRQQAKTAAETVHISALHTIALANFPGLLQQVEKRAGPFNTRMNATEFYDCIESLSLGRCDLSMAYVHPLGPPVLQTGQFVSRKIASDPFVLVTGTGADGEPLFRLEPRDDAYPLISYSADTFLGKVQTDLTTQLARRGIRFQTVFENTMSEAVKRMVLTGKGLGFLPRAAAEREIAAGDIQVLGPLPSEVELEIRVFRKIGPGSKVMERFWNEMHEVA
ncbi:LysR substrate-binding domain-containing protein [Roseibium aestuarii]|uniref:LysR substrate-binding domain-containing protein n=1 Tax=Roseibium aestuarii TaxID=2600299 RepID=A0ABW4JTG9_9HYPH|nr:LysR substrate-binding domain-containing protein [Roseibium aestuarii]